MSSFFMHFFFFFSDICLPAFFLQVGNFRGEGELRMCITLAYEVMYSMTCAMFTCLQEKSTIRHRIKTSIIRLSFTSRSALVPS